MSVYLNPFTDFGFKKLLGEIDALPQLKSFIEDALELAEPIEELSFMSAEQLGSQDDERKAIFDIYCTSKSGTHFIVELQRAKQHFFKDRTLFYASFPIRSQTQKGDWNYKLCPVYCLGILDFAFSDIDKLRWHHIVQLKDQEGKVFYDKLTFAYLELKKFNKTIDECSSHLEKWCYILRNLEGFEQIPEVFKEDDNFNEIFEKAEIANFSKRERLNYEESLKIYRDFTNVVNTAYDDGVQDMEGVVLEERKKVKLADKRADKERKRAELADKKAEKEKQKAEKEKQKAEKERKRAEKMEQLLQTALQKIEQFKEIE